MKHKVLWVLFVSLLIFLLVIFNSSVEISNIIQAPNEILTTVSEPITSFTEETKQISDLLTQAIYKVDSPLNIGLGIAAPQIGHNKRILVLKRSYRMYEVMINPEVIEKKWLLPSPSRCLSLKGLHFVPRYFWYHVKYQDTTGIEHEEIIRGPRAATFHQEMDHLNGVLLTDY